MWLRKLVHSRKSFFAITLQYSTERNVTRLNAAIKSVISLLLYETYLCYDFNMHACKYFNIGSKLQYFFYNVINSISRVLEINSVKLYFKQGALVSALADDTLHLWNLRQKRPAILHSLKFNRER